MRLECDLVGKLRALKLCWEMSFSFYRQWDMMESSQQGNVHIRSALEIYTW